MLVHQHKLVDQVLHERQRHSAVLDATGRGARERVVLGEVDHAAGLDALEHHVRGTRLARNDAHLRLLDLDEGRDAAQQTATTDAGKHVVDRGAEYRRLLEQLEPDRALAAHHEPVVVGREVRHALGVGDRARVHLGVETVGAVRESLGAEQRDAVHLGGVGALGHEDASAHATEQPRRVRHRHAVVAGARGHDATSALLVIERQHLVECST